MAQVRIELLQKHHVRDAFDCGKEALDGYLKRLARQHQEKGFAKTFVAVEEGRADVLGFISLAMGHVTFENADEAVFARLPRHPMPVLHVARIATDRRYQGRGIASMLLAHAADIAIEASDSMGIYAMELEALDDDAYQFYLRRGFLPLKGDTMRLYVPIATLKAARE